ncbi:MAG: hypothetical protein K8S98_01530 [Planctomycetes bacterium]|nr:hypothetical protein [Planctomycetota bacterium]
MIAWIVSFVGACFHVEVLTWEAQDLHLQYDAKTDVARMLLIHENVSSADDGSDGCLRAAGALEAIASRKRFFTLGDFPFEIDLDGAVPDALMHPLEEPDDGDPRTPLARCFADSLQGVKVIDAKLLLHRGKLAFVQTIEFPKFSALVACTNDAFTSAVSTTETPDESAGFTPEEWGAWRRRARSGTPWIEVRGDGLTFRAPHGPRWLAAFLGDLYRDVGKDQIAFIAGLAAALTEVAFENGDVAFRWNAPEGRPLHLHFGRPANTRDDEGALNATLLARGRSIVPGDLEEIARSFAR